MTCWLVALASTRGIGFSFFATMTANVTFITYRARSIKASRKYGTSLVATPFINTFDLVEQLFSVE